MPTFTLPTSGYAIKATIRRDGADPMESITWIGSDTEADALTRWLTDNDGISEYAPSDVEHDRALVLMANNRVIDVLAHAHIRGRGVPLSQR
jgi:hypothetical protein